MAVLFIRRCAGTPYTLCHLEFGRPCRCKVTPDAKKQTATYTLVVVAGKVEVMDF